MGPYLNQYFTPSGGTAPTPWTRTPSPLFDRLSSFFSNNVCFCSIFGKKWRKDPSLSFSNIENLSLSLSFSHAHYVTFPHTMHAFFYTHTQTYTQFLSHLAPRAISLSLSHPLTYIDGLPQCRFWSWIVNFVGKSFARKKRVRDR